MINGSLQRENVTLVTINTPEYAKQMLTNMKGDMRVPNNSGGLQHPTSIHARSCGQKTNKETVC